MNIGRDRREFARYRVPPMYTPIAVRLLDRDDFSLEGHAYDISEGGVQFECDDLLETGTHVALRLTLPPHPSDVGPGRDVFVFANVVWVADEDDPPPYRTAAVFTRFARAIDRERLRLHLETGRYRIAA